MEMMTGLMLMMAALLLVPIAEKRPNKMYVQAAAYCNVGGCPAWALFVVPFNDTLYLIANRFSISPFTVLQSLNNISDANNIVHGQLLRIPFNCDCPSSSVSDDFLSHSFYYAVGDNDSDITIATIQFSNLTTVEAIDSINQASQITTPGSVLQIPVNCSCGNPAVSKDYGMFGTYAAQPNDTLLSLSHKFNISQELLRSYNPSVSFDPLQPFTSILFIPTTNSSGEFPPLVTSTQSPAGGGNHPLGIFIGLAIGTVIFLTVLGIGFWFLWPRCVKRSQKLPGKENAGHQQEETYVAVYQEPHTRTDPSMNTHGTLPADHCVQFTYDELALATDRFSLSRQIGKGGFATVFYGEWQGKKLAVKRMDMKETVEFASELRILSAVHHSNLVELVGYCTEKYLTVVYEYMENETLSHHLRHGTKPMKWGTRLQIALDAARGVEYMHDHTRPTYIHRDLKPSNILLDSNFRAKVGDFGLTKLLDPDGDGSTKTTGPKGTFGYMPPEYAQFGRITVKVDVYAFGVILFQLISGREALHGMSGVLPLPSTFQEAFERTDAEEAIKTLVDPALGTEYPFESVWKMACLASRCTHKEPHERPAMREVVMQLMMLSDFGDQEERRI